MNVNLHAFRHEVGAVMRGSCAPSGAPKHDFGQKLNSNHLRASLDSLHQRIRSATSAEPLYDLVDEYVATVAQLAGMFPWLAGHFAPRGSLLSGAIAAVVGRAGLAREGDLGKKIRGAWPGR